MPYLVLLTFILAPAYVLKFNLLGLPTDILMAWVILVWIVFFGWLLVKKKFGDYINFKINLNKKLLIFISLFLIAGLISLFIQGFNRAKLGQFIVLFLQPISLFFISAYIFHIYPRTKTLLLVTCYLLLALAGLYGLIQYTTLLGLPPAWWGNSDEPKRALSFFIHPNFYALWAGPLLALLVPDLGLKIKNLKNNWHYVAAWVLGAMGLFLSLSRAGWLGLAAAVVVYLIIAADSKIRKTIFAAFIVIVIVIFSVPNFRFRILLPFYGEKSTVSRFSLWQTGIKGIKEDPIFGLGLTGFSNQWQTLNTDPGLTDTHNFPHNIFLDFWVETGLLGLISFIGVAWLGLCNGFKNRKDIIKLGVALFLFTLIIQGQADNPYFKNDLAMVFWIVLAIML